MENVFYSFCANGGIGLYTGLLEIGRNPANIHVLFHNSFHVLKKKLTSALILC